MNIQNTQLEEFEKKGAGFVRSVPKASFYKNNSLVLNNAAVQEFELSDVRYAELYVDYERGRILLRPVQKYGDGVRGVSFTGRGQLIMTVMTFARSLGIEGKSFPNLPVEVEYLPDLGRVMSVPLPAEAQRSGVGYGLDLQRSAWQHTNPLVSHPTPMVVVQGNRGVRMNAAAIREYDIRNWEHAAVSIDRKTGAFVMQQADKNTAGTYSVVKQNHSVFVNATAPLRALGVRENHVFGARLHHDGDKLYFVRPDVMKEVNYAEDD